MGRIKTPPQAAASVFGLKVRNGKFVVDKIVDKVRIYRTLDTGDVNLARKIVARLTNEVLEERYLPRKRSSLTVQDVLNLFWKGHLIHKPYARNTRHVLNAVANRLGEIELSKISRTDIELYKRERFKDINRNNPNKTRNISPRTVQKELQHLSMAINFAADSGVLDFNPIKRFIHVPQGQPAKVVLDDGYENGPEWEALYDALHKRVKPIALTLYETGMRPKECFNMRWNWLREKAPDRWVITVPQCIDKTGNEHDVPVSARLLALFKSMGMGAGAGGGVVFPAQRSVSGVREKMDTAFTSALARSGLAGRGISPYALRRTRITIWDAVDSNACRYAVGHVPREVHLRHYVRISQERLFGLVGLDFTPAFWHIPQIAENQKFCVESA
jgi:integrase